MNKIFRRFVAYTIDMMVITLVVQSLVGIPQINKQLDNYNKYYNEYIKEYQSYLEFKTDLRDYYEDKKLSTEEYEKIVDENDKYKDTVDKYYKDAKLTKKNYDKLNSDVDREYNEWYKDIYYKIEKNSILYFGLYLIAIIAYFVGFTKYTNGQTLGKKLMRLRIVNAKDSNSNVSVFSYIIRAIILYQPVLYLVKLIGINFMDAKMYLDVTSVIYDIQYYLELAVIVFAMIRLDGRGLHDLLAGTRVLRYDKNGKEVEDKFNEVVMKAKKEMSKASEDSDKDISSNEDTEAVDDTSPEVEIVKEKKKSNKRNTGNKSQNKKKTTLKKKVIEEPKK